SFLAVLFILYVLFTAFRSQAPSLHTALSTASGVLSIVATFAATVLSFLEDQRSFKPSDTLVIYFSFLTILQIPRLRSLWLMSSVGICQGLWTAIFAVTVGLVLLESASKACILRPVYLTLSPEEVCGFWPRSFFAWVLPLFRTGFSTTIGIGDIPEVDHDLRGHAANAKLSRTWTESKGSRRLITALFRAYRWSILSAIVPRIALIAFTLCQPFLIAATVNWIGSEITTETKGYGQSLVGAYVIVYFGMAISTAVYFQQVNRFATMTRAGLISMIYDKTMTLKAKDLKDAKAVTLMGTDMERILNAIKNMHEIWASVIQAGIAIWLLERQVHVACVVPTIISLLCVYFTGPVSTRMASAQKAWIERIQKRLAITSAMLGDMKAAQMLGLKDLLFNIINELRELELKDSLRFRKIMVIVAVLSNAPQYLAPYAMFLTYGIIAAVAKNQTLLAAQAFASLSLVSLVTAPLIKLVFSIPILRQAIGCLERVEQFCMKEDLVTDDTGNAVSIDNHGPIFHGATEMSALNVNNQLIDFKNASVSWSKDSDIVLAGLNFSIPANKITMVIGSVGSGKSLLLESIIGETTIRQGGISGTLSYAAYCPQTPWLMNSTIRHNITGGSDFDPKWYDFAISSCALQRDLENFESGDYYKAGSDGSSLSGGQKQRVSLARAVYSRLPVAILDDVFSGLDSRSTKSIMQSLFSQDGYFRTSKTSVILTTHNLDILPYADHIIALGDGKIVDSGSYGDILAHNPDLFIASTSTEKEPEDEPKLSIKEDISRSKIEKPDDQVKNKETGTVKDSVDILRRNGTWGVYQYYIHRAGPYICLAAVGVMIIQAFTAEYATVWLQNWSSENEKNPNGHLAMYLGIYTLLNAVTLIGLVGSAWLITIVIITNTARGLHTDLLKATLSAPISFLQKSNKGSLINRFSQDINLIDMQLPIYVYNFTEGAAMCIVILVIICVMGKYFAVAIPVIAIILWGVQLYYLRTSRQVRLLDIEAKAPLYSQFMETESGVSVVRLMRWQTRFRSQCEEFLDYSQKPLYMLYCIQQWLKLILDLVVMAMAVVIVATATGLKDHISPGAAGVALTLVLLFNDNLTHTIQFWTLTEISIGAVARIQRFAEDTPSEGRPTCDPAPPSHEWPLQGAISFEDVTACYSTDTAPVLKRLSLAIKPGEKVAICGQSGSGKTSLILSLLQMIDLQSGKITVDDVDLASLDRNDIRTRLSVVTQEPFFIPGSIRLNLDPHNRASDESIASSIKKTGLWARVEANGGLDMTFTASDWSMGERQLFSLARALTTQSPILVLDEATSR
ncbi:hypothetical protein EIK77_007950, partial [Talaromyces pinophilus]